jgi:hypothetical protein
MLARPAVRCAAVLSVPVLLLGLAQVPAAAAPTGSSDASQYTPVVGRAGQAVSARPVQSAQAEARIATQVALRPTAQELVRQSTAAGSDIAGVRYDLDAGVIHLYRTDQRRSVRLSGAAAGAAGKVVVHPARFSHIAMTAAQTRLVKEADGLVAAGVTVDAVGPNVDGSGLTVAVVAADAKALDTATVALRATYGDLIAAVTAVPQAASDKSLYFSGLRFNDSAPWTGGDRIQTPAGGCTTGFSALLSGSPVALTAAHCGSAGWPVVNGPTFAGTYNTMGTIAQSDGNTDIGAIAVADSWPFVNAGPAESPYQMLVLSWGAPIQGETVCQSGSYTGEVCQLFVVDTNVRSCVRRNIFGSCRQWTGNFADAINLAGSGVPATGHGDSGAPVYEFGAPSAGVGNGVGLVHGQMTGVGSGNWPAYVPDTLSCASPEGVQPRCSSGFSFAHLPGF